MFSTYLILCKMLLLLQKNYKITPISKNFLDKLEQWNIIWHSSGTFAVVCLMTGKTVASYSTLHYESPNATTTLPNQPGEQLYTPLQVATAVTFMVGIYQVITL